MQAMFMIGRSVLGTCGMVFGYEMFVKAFRDYNQKQSKHITDQMAIAQKTLNEIADKKKQAQSQDEIDNIERAYNEFKNNGAKIHVGFTMDRYQCHSREVSMDRALTYLEEYNKKQETFTKVSLVYQANKFLHKQPL